MLTPSGRMPLISSSFLSTRAITAEEFSPCSLTTIPATTSPAPSRVCRPRRTAPPMRTAATSERWMGRPCSVLTTIDSRSSMPVARPSDRTTSSSAFRSMNWAPTFRLFARTRSTTSASETS